MGWITNTDIIISILPGRSLWVITLLLSLISVGAVSPSSSPTPEPTSPQTIGDLPRTVTTDNTEYAYKQLSMAQRTNCTLKPTNVRLYHEIKKSLEDGMTMLEYEFKLEDGVELDVMHDNADTALFLPLFWFRYVGRFSSRLLLLKPNYDVMSFQILDIGVRKFTNITLREEPKGCLSLIGLREYEIIIRELVMTDFRITGNDTTIEAHDGSVCNMHVTDDEGWAEFKYYCCKYDDYTNVTCSYLEHDFYLDLMRTIIRVFKVLFILLCPALLPPRFYGHNRKMKQYKYKLSRPFRIFVQLKSENMGAINENAILVDDLALHKMEEFKKKITKEPPEVMKKGKVYEIDEAELKVQRYKLIESGHAPANIFDTIYRSLVLCKIRDLPSLKDCCSANLFPSSFGCVYTWRMFCRVLGRFIYTLVILTPWIVRLAIYYVFEREEIETRKKSAEDNDLLFKFPGNLTMLLTPIHVVFVIIYVVIAIEGVIFKKLNQKIVHDLQYVFKHCFRDMMKEKKTKAVCNIVKMLLLPFRQLGILVFIIGPFLWLLYIPLAIFAFLFYMFPTINITIRLLYNLVALPCGPETSSGSRARQNNNTNTFTTIIQSLQPENLCNIEVHGEINRNRHNQRSTCQYIVRMIVKCVVILITMVTVYSCIILLTEFAVFFVDVVVYTLIGCILYANHTMTYISLLVLTSLYAKDAYGTVSQKYRDFSAVLNKYIFNLRGEQLKSFFL